MEWILIAVGIILICCVAIDILLTTVHCNGAGFIANPVSRSVWKLLFILAGKNGKKKLLNYAGLIVVMSVIIFWILMMHIGFDLIFIANKNSIVTASNKLPTDVSDKIYYVSYTLFTMGNGDFTPASDFYQIITGLCTAFGLFVITLSITYLIPIVSAVVEMRQLSSNIYYMGQNPQEWLNQSWNGYDYKNIENQLQEFNTQLSKHNERHLAYPVLHFFHSTQKKYAAPITIAILNESIIILSEAIPDDKRPNNFQLNLIHKNLENYANTIATQYNFKGTPPPHNSDLQAIHGTSETVVSKEFYEKYNNRRGIFHKAVLKDGWSWNDVI